MTADFLTDLDVIGHLDWTPGCDWFDSECGETPAWNVVYHLTCCREPRDFLLCDGHKRELEQRWDKRIGLCLTCDTIVPASALVIDRIIPLGGSNGCP